MYFPSEDERRYVLRKLLPQARKQGVFEELRGWNWHQPPMSPVYDEARLGVAEIASGYCVTGRDVFQRRVMQAMPRPNRYLEEGRVLHQALASLIVAAKREIYVHGASCLRQVDALRTLPRGSIESIHLSVGERAELERKETLLREYECRRLAERIQEAVARDPHAGADAIAAQALPVIVEQRLDGRYLGLSSNLSADAFLFAGMMVADVKFGPKEEFDRLTTAGYALVLESIYECPIDLGCVIYVSFDEDRILVERDFHIIDDEARQEFINLRDEKARMVEEAEDPGLPAACYQWCEYLPVCMPGSQGGRQKGAQRAGSANRAARDV